ncbi:MAG: EAL domain-containing protein [Thermodesulfobacteriota bacterium]
MTLYRQLLIFACGLFILLFAGTWFGKLKDTQIFLNNQLESHAQDTATSLGLSIQPYLNEGDFPVVETMVNAIADPGYYRAVKIYDVDDKLLLERLLEVEIEGVPSWFIELIPLQTPEAATLLSSGWNQAGRLTVESHPGYAYKTLWDETIHMTIWFAVIFCVVLAIGGLGLRILLKPLSRVEEQANGLCRKHFEVQKVIPRTRELKQMVEAMNRMTTMVKAMFIEQVQIAERMRQQAFRDSLTGLGNRRYFEGQVKTRMDRGGVAVKGALLMLEIHHLTELNQEKGFEAGDKLLTHVTRLLQSETADVANCALARMTGGDFAIFLPDVTPEGAEQIGHSLLKKLAALASQEITLNDNVAHIGIVIYDRKTPIDHMLSGADHALRSAQQDGPNTLRLEKIGDEEERVLGQHQWKEKLLELISEKAILLFGQPAVRCSNRDRVMHQEIFSRMRGENDEIISAGMFMPLAERLGLVSALDKIVISKVIDLDRYKTPIVAVNIAASSLGDDDFRGWLLHTLNNTPPSAPRLVLEFAEFGAVQHLEILKRFADQVRDSGHNIALDHFGQSFSNFGYLQSLKPEYVKIDRAYTSEIKAEENDSSFFISSLCSVAHSLDITVIAEAVETEEQSSILRDLHLDGIQGYLIAPPQQIGTKNGSIKK